MSASLRPTSLSRWRTAPSTSMPASNGSVGFSRVGSFTRASVRHVRGEYRLSGNSFGISFPSPAPLLEGLEGEGAEGHRRQSAIFAVRDHRIERAETDLGMGIVYRRQK